ncbi:hypothetical protein ACFO0N_18180 [Halobium salinum]|uniref:Uncharacterized protein n=1 Tax=Halobium salinum TaxID=1364940 RepID=A0ABD5PGH4_9EURY|nr:hypothetical protein [Halobium salinum]
MVLGLALALLALAELFAPKRVVEFWLRVAVSNPDTVEVRPWLYALARLEGVVILLWLVRRRRGSPRRRLTPRRRNPEPTFR